MTRHQTLKDYIKTIMEDSGQYMDPCVFGDGEEERDEVQDGAFITNTALDNSELQLTRPSDEDTADLDFNDVDWDKLSDIIADIPEKEPQGAIADDCQRSEGYSQWLASIAERPDYAITNYGMVFNIDDTYSRVVARAGPLYRGYYDFELGVGFMSSTAFADYDDLLDHIHPQDTQDKDALLPFNVDAGDPKVDQGGGGDGDATADNIPKGAVTVNPDGSISVNKDFIPAEVIKGDTEEFDDLVAQEDVAFSSTTGLSTSVLATRNKSPGLVDTGKDKSGSWDDYTILPNGKVFWGKVPPNQK